MAWCTKLRQIGHKRGIIVKQLEEAIVWGGSIRIGLRDEYIHMSL